MHRILLALLLMTLSVAAGPREPPQFKGWELYSYNQDGEWHYVLLTGTNRLKFRDEVFRGSSMTLEALKARFAHLAVGEYVFWNRHGMDNSWGQDLDFPEDRVMAEIKESAERAEIHLQISP
jgi:hypothetical protein